MGEYSGIEWCDHTFNPWMGCTKVSPACANCYAERDFDHRYGKVKWGPSGTRVMTSASTWGKPLKWNREAKVSGTRPRVFCASLADVFESWEGPIHNSKGDRLFFQIENHWSTVLPGPFAERLKKPVPITMDHLRRRLFEVIDVTPNIDWLLLTKRPENVEMMWPCKQDTDGDGNCNVCIRASNAPCRHRSNVWIGTTVENQEFADNRVPELLKHRDLAPVLFLSCEPMTGPVDLTNRDNGRLRQHWNWLTGGYWHESHDGGGGLCTAHPRHIDWVICGGESGPSARPADPEWFLSLRDQCHKAGVPFHFKQWGEFDAEQKRVGKKAAGRLLDGVQYDGFPLVSEV